jgi:hypothetical protein
VKADRTQEFLGAGCALLEEAKHRLSQDRQIIGPGMQVQLILLEFAVTRFSIGLQEARIDGQLHESLWVDADVRIA